jgi:hypothetical protein
VRYKLDVTPDARGQWLALDVENQEAVFDLIDHLTGGTETLPVNKVFARDVVLERGEERHYLFLTLRIEPFTRTLTVLGVSHLLRRRSEPPPPP